MDCPGSMGCSPGLYQPLYQTLEPQQYKCRPMGSKHHLALAWHAWLRCLYSGQLEHQMPQPVVLTRHHMAAVAQSAWHKLGCTPGNSAMQVRPSLPTVIRNNRSVGTKSCMVSSRSC